MTPAIPVSSAPAAAASSFRACALEGAIVIDSVADWQRRVATYLATAKEPALDLGAVTEIDAFGLQLLLAASRSAAARGQTLVLTSVPALFDESCRTAGLVRTAFGAVSP